MKIGYHPWSGMHQSLIEAKFDVAMIVMILLPIIF